MAEPQLPFTTRGVATPDQFLDPNRTPGSDAAGFGDQVAAAWRTQWGPQLVRRMFESWKEPVSGYDPFGEMDGYERYAADLAKVRSPEEMDAMKARIDSNIRDQATLAEGGMGWALAAELVAGFGDPVNYIPIPMARGIGFARGALKAGTANAALTAASEGVRYQVDPTMEANEAIISIGASWLLGGAMGGVAGSMGRRGGASHSQLQRSIERTMEDLNDLEGTNNWARDLHREAEGMEIKAVRELPDGRKADVVETMEPVRIKEVDGVNYFYEGRFPTAQAVEGSDLEGAWVHRWVKESEQRLPIEERTPLDPDTLRQLGAPEMEAVSRLHVREAKLKLDFERGELDGVDATNFKNADEYVTFRSLEALWRKLEPEATPEVHQAKALEEMKGSRESSFIGRAAAGTEWLLDKSNFSPVAKAARLFKNDNRLTDLALKIGGDYGWAVRANRLGYRTPPSLLVRSHKHYGRFLEVRREIDDAWVEYVNEGKTDRSAEFAGVNMTASASRLKRKVLNREMLQYNDFLAMAAESVWNKNDFEVNGHTVVPQARKAAKAITRLLQEYDREARELDMYYSQRSVKRKIQRKTALIRDQQAREIRWLWGDGGPNSWQFAVRVEDQLVTGESYEAITQQIIDRFGPETLDNIKPEEYGFVRRGGGTGPSRTFEYQWSGEGADDPLVQEFVRELIISKRNEKFSDPVNWTPEEQEAYASGDWEKFSRLRGYTDEEIAQYKKTQDLLVKVEQKYPEEDPNIASLAEEINFDTEQWLEVNEPTVRSWDQLPAETKMEFNRLAVAGELPLLREMRATTEKWFGPRSDIRSPTVLFGPEMDRAGSYNAKWNDVYVNYAAIREIIFKQHEDVANGLAEGRYTPEQVVSSLNNRAMQTFRHESIHALRSQGYLEQSEWNSLVKVAKQLGWFDKYSIESRYRTMYRSELRRSPMTVDWDNTEIETVLQDMLNEEAIAEGFAHWVRGEIEVPDEARGFFEKLLNYLKEILGIGQRAPESDLQKVMDLFDSLESGKLANREVTNPTIARGNRAISYETFDDGFRQFEEMRDARVRSLSPAQLEVYDRIRQMTDTLEAERAELQALYDESRENPGVFRDQGNMPEDYFPRVYDTDAIADNQEAFIRLATQFFGGDEAARARAEGWTAALLNGEVENAEFASSAPRRQGFQSLRGRRVDWPNSYNIVDPELGELKLSDFIHTNPLSVLERYTRRMGVQIETAKMFGDPNIDGAIAETRGYIMDRYLSGDMDDDKSRKLMQDMDEYVGHIKTTFNLIAGSYRKTDPWSLSNRTARGLKDWMALALMGRVALTSLPEMFRPMMVAGLDGAYKSIFEQVFNDLPQLKFNKRWTRAMAGDATDMARDTFNPRFAEQQAADLGQGGGTWIENKLHDAVPWYYKINGLTPLTMFLKDWTGLAAQHAIFMDILEPDAKSMERLAAVGIGKRQAAMLKKMPIERTQNGLILPVVQNWKGTEGRAAQRILLDATMGETRRTIVTPSVGDKSTLFYGLVTKGGQYVHDNDWYSVPFQFMSYGVAANNKVLGSMLQGRDRSMAGGIFAMMLMGLLSNYLKTPENAWNNKDYKERLIDAYEAAGIGGFIAGDINLMLERYSANTLGIRPMMGSDPKFGKAGVDNPIDIAGPGPGTLFDLTRVFWDEDLSTTAKAQTVRRALIFNNYLFTAGFARGIANDVGEALK